MTYRQGGAFKTSLLSSGIDGRKQSPFQKKARPKEDLVAPKSREYQPQASDSRAIVVGVPISPCRLQPLAAGLASGGKQTASLEDERHRYHHWQHNDGWQS